MKKKSPRQRTSNAPKLEDIKKDPSMLLSGSRYLATSFSIHVFFHDIGTVRTGLTVLPLVHEEQPVFD